MTMTPAETVEVILDERSAGPRTEPQLADLVEVRRT